MLSSSRVSVVLVVFSGKIFKAVTVLLNAGVVNLYLFYRYRVNFEQLNYESDEFFSDDDF